MFTICLSVKREFCNFMEYAWNDAKCVYAYSVYSLELGSIVLAGNSFSVLFINRLIDVHSYSISKLMTKPCIKEQ